MPSMSLTLLKNRYKANFAYRQRQALQEGTERIDLTCCMAPYMVATPPLELAIIWRLLQRKPNVLTWNEERDDDDDD